MDPDWRRKDLLRDDQPPPLGPAVDEAFAAFLAKRKAAMPDLSYT